MNLAYEGAKAGGIVHVLDDHDAGRGNGEDVAPPIGAIVVVVRGADLHRRICAANTGRGGVTDHGGPTLEDAFDAGARKTRVGQTHVKRFDRAGYDASAEGAELLDLGRGQRRCAHGSPHVVWAGRFARHRRRSEPRIMDDVV